MTFRPERFLLLAGIVLTTPWTLPAAHAALGGNAAGIGADAVAMHGDELVTTLPACDVHVISTPDGLRVTEYTDLNGTVFAVTWAGPVVPDLSQLLGASYQEFMAALAAQGPRASHRSLRIATPQLVVENGGHMRAFYGRAYLPALIPAGMTVTDVR